MPLCIRAVARLARRGGQHRSDLGGDSLPLYRAVLLQCLLMSQKQGIRRCSKWVLICFEDDLDLLFDLAEAGVQDYDGRLRSLSGDGVSQFVEEVEDVFFESLTFVVPGIDECLAPLLNGHAEGFD